MRQTCVQGTGCDTDATLDRRFERTLSMLVKLKALREA